MWKNNLFYIVIVLLQLPLLAVVSFLSPLFASVVINEFQVEPSGASQWIELYNAGDNSEDVSGWIIDDNGGTEKYTIALGSVISPSNCLTFQSEKFNWNVSSADTARLFSGDTLIDSYTYAKSPGSGISFGRSPDGTGEFTTFTEPTHGLLNANRQTCSASPTSTPTPTLTIEPTAIPIPTTTPTPTPAPVSFPEGISLSEFLANPIGEEKEWVEIYNSDSSSADLLNWFIDDDADGSSPQSFSAVLLPHQHKKIQLSSNKLNNGGDTVRLLKPDSTVADFVNYSSSQKGVVWAKNDNGEWSETSIPTPDEPNQFVPVGGFPHSGDLLELKKLTLGSKIEISAFVSVPLGVFSGKEFYLVDDFSGIKVILSEDSRKEMKLGDKIHIASTIEESHSEKYIQTDDFEVLQNGLRYPDPLEISTGEVAEVNEGRLVKIRGLYERSEGDSFFINDGTGELKIYLKESTGIIKLKMEKGDEVEVQGVVSQYGFLKDGPPNYRLMPRFQGDLRNLSQEKKAAGSVLGAATVLPVTGSTSTAPFIFISSGLFLRLVLKFSREAR